MQRDSNTTSSFASFTRPTPVSPRSFRFYLLTLDVTYRVNRLGHGRRSSRCSELFRLATREGNQAESITRIVSPPRYALFRSRRGASTILREIEKPFAPSESTLRVPEMIERKNRRDRRPFSNSTRIRQRRCPSSTTVI